jgi:SWI/SNF-related matrix-associated actin-dependent regulator of chromatin subfamily A member 5
MLRRTKATVEISVPPREEHTVFVPLTEAQRFWTLRLLTRLDTVDLKQIFTEDLTKDGTKAEEDEMDEGRKEVLRHIKEQVQGGLTKAGEQNRACSSLLVSLNSTLLMLS